MSPSALPALLAALLAVPVAAGQVEAPVSGQAAPASPSGAIGSSVGAPVPLQMTVPTLTAGAAPSLASALVPAPGLVRPQAAPAAAAPAAVPALPASAVTPARPRALAGNVKPAAAAPESASREGGADAGRALFDGGPGPVESPRFVSRAGASRGEGWEVNGRPARRLSGGAFKEVLLHPLDPGLVIKVFSEAGAKDAAGSLAEKRREMRNLEPLLRIGRAPAVAGQGALALRTPSGGERAAGYIVQDRVAGRELGDMLRDRDPAVRARALKEARALFEDLVAARIKLEDRVKMGENVSIGRAGGRGGQKAWVLDAGEATLVAGRGKLDKLLGRPDPLRAYYDSVLAELSALARR